MSDVGDPKKSTKRPEAAPGQHDAEDAAHRAGGPFPQLRDDGEGVPAHPYQLPKDETDINVEKGRHDSRSIHGE